MKKLIFSFIVITLFFGGLIKTAHGAKAFQVDTGGTLTTGLLAYYPLENTTEYFIGNGTLDFTNVSSTAFNAGKVNNGADFGVVSTTASYLALANNLGVDGSTTTISGWMNVTKAPPAGTIDGYMLLNSNTSDVSYAIGYRNTAGTFTLEFNRRRNAVQDNWITYTTTLTTSTWYMVTLTYGGGNLTGYLNGSAVVGPTAKSGSGSDTWAHETTVGRSYNAGLKAADGQYAEGKVDEVGYWNKVLTSTEITDLYNGGSGQTMITSANTARRRSIIIQ